VAADDGSTDYRTRTVGLYTISLTPPGDSVVCRPEETVLSAILRSGAKVAFGCRGGGCGTCKMRLLSGRVDHGRCSAAVLPEEQKRKGSFLSCQARPLGDLTVELTATNRYRRLNAWSIATGRGW
jgi:CDP-4-dehydro-6-deoxyglucose reductase